MITSVVCWLLQVPGSLQEAWMQNGALGVDVMGLYRAKCPGEGFRSSNLRFFRSLGFLI